VGVKSCRHLAEPSEGSEKRSAVFIFFAMKTCPFLLSLADELHIK
jgi:hypothetical protein